MRLVLGGHVLASWMQASCRLERTSIEKHPCLVFPLTENHLTGKTTHAVGIFGGDDEDTF